MGISRTVVDRYVDEWIVSIDDYSPLVQSDLSPPFSAFLILSARDTG